MTQKPWERQPGETSKAFGAFTLYRDLGFKRSLTNVARLYNANRDLRGQMGRWSKKFNWVQRALAHDEYLDKLKFEEKEKSITEMKKRHLTLAMTLQSKAAARLKDLDGKDMKTRDAISAIAQGTRLERLIRGEPTEQVRGELIATIREERPIPWENIPEVKKAVEKLRERMKKEKNADATTKP